MAIAQSGFVSLDCADPVALAEFWAAMLGGEIMFSSTETVDVRTEGADAYNASHILNATAQGGHVRLVVLCAGRAFTRGTVMN